MTGTPIDINRCSLQMTEPQWQMLIARLEAGETPPQPAARDREAVRYPHVRRMGLRVAHSGGRLTYHVVRSRNLSSGGAGFLHGQFLYPQTACHLLLPTRWDEFVVLAGTVCWCRHVQGISHEAGMRFERAIQIDEFLDPKTCDLAAGGLRAAV